MAPVIVSGSLLVLCFIVRICLGFRSPAPVLELGVASTIGDREHQADQFEYAKTDAGFMLSLADGVGSGEKGKIAASIAVDTCRMQFERLSHLDNAGFFFQKAFKTVNHDILEIVDDGTAGSSLLCAIVSDGMLYYALAGNCRLSVFRNNFLVPLSEGHTIDMLAKQSFRTGRLSRQDTLAALQERRVYNFIGQDGFHNIEFYDTPVKLKVGDIVVLMSDGAAEIYGVGRMEQLLQNGGSCEDMAFEITDTINREPFRVDKDNATVMLLRVNKSY